MNVLVIVLAVLCIVAGFIVAGLVAQAFKMGFGAWMGLWALLSLGSAMSIPFASANEVWSVVLAAVLVAMTIVAMVVVSLRTIRWFAAKPTQTPSPTTPKPTNQTTSV